MLTKGYTGRQMMKWIKVLSVMVFLFRFGTGALATAPAATRSQPTTRPTTSTKPNATTQPKIILHGTHAQMAKVCNLSIAQQKKILELRNQRLRRIKNFYKVHGKEMEQLKSRIIQARREGKKAEVNRIYKKLQALLAERRLIDRKSREEIINVLTDEQKVRWYHYIILRTIKRRFASAKLTNEQIKKVKAILPQFTQGENISDKKVRYKIIKKLDNYIRENILTEDQKKAISPPAKWKKRFSDNKKRKARQE